ncbi:SapC family protein [Ideonella sp. DXS22W]|uniref:SapC family protein n=1 Tax=Pseudaquabacterium inlustre TaxID=2984192 RepID=A0ABU9CP24_9BURK
MTQAVALDPAQHAHLRILTSRGAAWGDEAMSALVVPAEFRAVQACYPIVFEPTADGAMGGYQPVALFGLEPGQNLFLGLNGWDAPCLPMSVERQPFLIGRGGPHGEQLNVHVDLAHPRVSHTHGEPVFDALGQPSPYLERITGLLGALHEGVQQLPGFIDALLGHELLESFVLDVTDDDGSVNRLAGYFTIHEERLAALDGRALTALHHAGHLALIYMVLASTAQFPALIERRKRRLTGLA